MGMPTDKTRYEISVWDVINGDIVKKLWDADQRDYDDVFADFEGEPGIEIVIDREWEEDWGDDD